MAGRKKRRWAILTAVVVVCGFIIAVYMFRFGPLAGKAVGPADSLHAAGDTSSSGDSLTTRGSTDRKKENGKKNDGKKEEIERVMVEVAEAAPRKISSYYFSTAALEPEKRVDILVKTAGQVEKIFMEEGDVVKEGALLCALEDKEQKVALDEARINRDKQRREFERLKAVHERSLISDKEFSDITYQYELAMNQYDAALLRYDYTKIRAPFSGVLTERTVDKGQNVTVGAKLFAIADMQPMLLRLHLPENEVASIKLGQEVFITPDSDPVSMLSGRIMLISPRVDERTGTVKVTVETKGNAMPGSFVRVRIVTDTHDETLAVPRRSVVADAGETFVFVAEADTVRKVDITIGFEDENFAE
ncbi:MAG: efflux RND transporter periplasmic adaptor subunit, partial [Candidatus Latescibacterota bacterium]